MRHRFVARTLQRLRPWLGLPLAFLVRDLWPTALASLCLLGPAVFGIWSLGSRLALALPLLPIVVLVASTLVVEIGLPELSGFRRQQSRKDATPQAVYYLVKALSRLERRPWLERIFWAKPRYHRGSLRVHLYSQLLATRLMAGQMDEAEAVLAKLYQLSEERGGLCHHNEAVFWARRGELERARQSVKMSRALGLRLPARESRVQYSLERWLRGQPSAHLVWIASVGELYQQLGFHQPALQCLQLSRSQDAAYRLVTAHLALGDVESAQRVASEAKRRAGNSSWTWLACGTLQVYREESIEARLSFENGLLLNPGCRELKKAFHDLRIQHTPQDQLPGLLRQIAEQETDDTLRLAALAQTKARLEQWEASIGDAMIALGMGAKDVALLECLGHSWCRLGVPASGIHFLRRFHELVELRQPILALRQERLERARSVWETFDEDCGQLGLP